MTNAAKKHIFTSTNWFGLGTIKQVHAATPQDGMVLQFRPTPRRGLNREESAKFVGVSSSKFDEMIKDGRMPPPIRIDGRVLWDIHQLDAAFDRLCSGDDEDENPWGDVGRIKG